MDWNKLNVNFEVEPQRAEALLREMGLDDRINQYPHELSAGERQRVAIARALANDPAILLADEPTGNLDSHSGEEVMEIFDTLHKEGRTLIVVTHDPNVAKRSPRVVSIRDGHVVYDGGPEYLKDRSYMDAKKEMSEKNEKKK